MEREATRALPYARNSSKKQKSIDDQAAENRAAAEANGWTVVDELSDPSSASRYRRKERQNWATLLELLPTVDVVILWEPSRGDRDLETWAGFLNRCREHHVRIHAVTHQRTYDPRNARDYRSLAEDGVDSAYESDKTSGRVRRGKATAAAAGKPAGPHTYGYTRRYDPQTRKLSEQVEHPQHAAVVRDIIGSLASGEAVSSVAKRLARAGVPTPQGAVTWYTGTIKSIARNEAYRPYPEPDPETGKACGTRVHDGQSHRAVWPPLVTEQVWQAAQQVLGSGDPTVRAARKAVKPGQPRYLLSGSQALMNAPCGNDMTGWSPQAGRTPIYKCALGACVSCPIHEADEYVTRLVVARLSRDDARELWVADDTAARTAAEELARLRAELAEAQASFARPGGISAAAMAAKESAMAPAIADAERRARPNGVSLAALKLIDAARMGKDRVRPTWDALPLPARREVVAGLFASLVLGPATARLTRHTPPEERLVIVAERIAHEWRRP